MFIGKDYPPGLVLDKEPFWLELGSKVPNTGEWESSEVITAFIWP